MHLPTQRPVGFPTTLGAAPAGAIAIPASPRRIDLDQFVPGWLRDAPGLACGRLQQAARRGIDILESLALIVLTLPVLIVTAIAIRLESPGPVLFRQERIGLDGAPFVLLKFRSMRTDAERDGPAWATQQDPRVTRIGRLLRRLRIDELPQLINVLKGEMSLVGPRPERPHFVAQLDAAIPNFAARTRVKPGITGWAQVNFPYGASIEDARQKLSYDLYYVMHRSLWLDFIIVLATIRVVLFQVGSR
jgi:exopolysaccharide biosynthesis polyprenyl glycosylphosphotransferase